jgi:hypothetical protein
VSCEAIGVSLSPGDFRALVASLVLLLLLLLLLQRPLPNTATVAS